MFLSRCGKTIRYKVLGVKRKPKRYLLSFLVRTFTEMVGLIGLGILSNLVGILAECMQKIWNFICRLPFDAQLLWSFLRELTIKIVASLKPSNLLRLLMSLPLEIRHINGRCMALLALYWNETRRILRCMRKPRELIRQMRHFLCEHIRNRNRVIRGIVAVFCTILMIRLLLLLRPYLYFILPTVLLIYLKPLLPMMLHFLAGLAGRKMGCVIYRQLKKKITLLRRFFERFDRKSNSIP